MTTHAHDLLGVAARLASGAMASDADLMALGESTDILSLGMLADDARRARHGSIVTFVRVADVALPATGVIPAIPPGAREVRVATGTADVDAQVDGLRAVVQAAGAVPVSAYSLADLESSARVCGRPLVDLCGAVRHTGVAALAEAPIDRLADAESACRAARHAGLAIARVTISRTADTATRILLLRRVVALQRAVGGLWSFAPLARTWNPAAPSTGYEDVRQVALARLVLTDMPSIQVDWTLYGPKLAQVALTMGADDLDAVSAVDDSADGRRRAPLQEVLRNIRAAALTPAERDGLYRRISA